MSGALPACCAAVVECYRLARAGDPRDGAHLYCADCTSQIVVRVTLGAEDQRIIFATKGALASTEGA